MSTELLDIHELRQTFPRADGGEHLAHVLRGVRDEGHGYSAAPAISAPYACASRNWLSWRASSGWKV